MNRDEEIAIEWDCQKLLRQYYHYVDQKEYEKAAELFTPDVEWSSMSIVLKGRDDIIKGTSKNSSFSGVVDLESG